MTDNQKFVHQHRSYFSFEWDGENFYYLMGQFAPNPGEKVIVSDEELGRRVQSLLRSMAIHGSD